MSLGSHANVYNTCLRILRQRGYALRLDYDRADGDEHESPLWIAERDGFRFTADNAIELLGLTAVYEDVKPPKDEPYWWTVNGPDIWSELRDDARRPLNGSTLPLNGSRQAHPIDQRTDTRDDTRDVNGRRIPVLGLLACAFALIPMFAVLAAKMLYTIGGRYRDLGKSVGVIAVGYGFALEVLAVLAAVWAIVSAGPNRRVGLVALALVALSIALLYL